MHVPNQLVGAPLGTDVQLECFVEAHPRAITYWENRDAMVMNTSRITTHTLEEHYKIHMVLSIRGEGDIRACSTHVFWFSSRLCNFPLIFFLCVFLYFYPFMYESKVGSKENLVFLHIGSEAGLVLCLDPGRCFAMSCSPLTIHTAPVCFIVSFLRICTYFLTSYTETSWEVKRICCKMPSTIRP